MHRGINTSWLVIVATWLGATASGCVTSDPPAVNFGYSQYGYGYGYGPLARDHVGVGEPTAEYVSGMPPDPLYEQVPPAPGDGFVWIDGYWHWNGEEWVWVGGRWEEQQDGYVYVEPYYTEFDGAYLYTPGYWRSGGSIPQGWIVERGAPGTRRPPVVKPPPSYVPTQGHIATRPVFTGTGTTTPPLIPGRGPVSPYGPVAPTRGVNQPAGPEPYGPPPTERRPPVQAPTEPVGEHAPGGGNNEGEAPIIYSRERGPAPVVYTPTPGPPVHQAPISTPVRAPSAPPSRPEPSRAPAPAPTHSSGGHH